MSEGYFKMSTWMFYFAITIIVLSLFGIFFIEFMNSQFRRDLSGYKITYLSNLTDEEKVNLDKEVEDILKKTPSEREAFILENMKECRLAYSNSDYEEASKRLVINDLVKEKLDELSDKKEEKTFFWWSG